MKYGINAIELKGDYLFNRIYELKELCDEERLFIKDNQKNAENFLNASVKINKISLGSIPPSQHDDFKKRVKYWVDSGDMYKWALEEHKKRGGVKRKGYGFVTSGEIVAKMEELGVSATSRLLFDIFAYTFDQFVFPFYIL